MPVFSEIIIDPKNIKCAINNNNPLLKNKPDKYIKSAVNWTAVFIFAKKVTSMRFGYPFCELKFRRAETQNSLARIKPPIIPMKALERCIDNAKIINIKRILSAIGSSMPPRTDSWSYFLAKYPSQKSEIPAKKNILNANPKSLLTTIKKKIPGDAIILKYVKN